MSEAAHVNIIIIDLGFKHNVLHSTNDLFAQFD